MSGLTEIHCHLFGLIEENFEIWPVGTTEIDRIYRLLTLKKMSKFRKGDRDILSIS